MIARAVVVLEQMERSFVTRFDLRLRIKTSGEDQQAQADDREALFELAAHRNRRRMFRPGKNPKVGPHHGDPIEGSCQDHNPTDPGRKVHRAFDQ